MGSTFGTYNIAYTGMYVSQASMTATSTNLANINTTGASKVQVSNEETNSVSSDGTVRGTGVNVQSILRSRDIYLDSNYRTQNVQAVYYSVKSGNLEYLDKLLSEYEVSSTDSSDSSSSSDDDTGLEQAIQNFFGAWETLSTDVTTESSREAVISAATDFISMLSEIDSQLQQLQADAVTGVKDGVDSLNDYASQVAQLNLKISQAEANGGEASYLRDQRDALLDQMSSLADITVTETNGVLKVSIGGVPLVKGGETHALVVEGTGTTDDPLTVKWADFDSTTKIKSGSIAAYLEDADQTAYTSISASELPYNFTTSSGSSSISTLRQGLNNLITTLANQVNALCTSGYDLNGNAGVAFFTVLDANQPLSISNIQVNPELVADSDKLAASSSQETGDNTLALAVCKLASDATCYKSGGLSLNITDYYKSIISWLGTAGETASANYTTQAALATQLDTQRQSVYSISIDEEVSNLIQFQNAYAASARVMSTIDNLLGDLIDAV